MNQHKKEIILDVGCGSSKLFGSIGIDQYKLPGVDVVHNLNSLPWPFQNQYFDRIIFSHSISHLNDIPAVMVEVYRLLKKGGILEIVAPHYASDNFNTDPTHKAHLGIRSMHYFVENVKFGYRYLPADCHFSLLKSNISFREAKTSWRPTQKFNLISFTGLEWLANKFPRIYERFFCSLLPPSEVYFQIERN